MPEARDVRHEPSLRRLPPDAPLREEIVRRHDAALAQGLPGYPDPATGLFVLTADALLARGACCGCGCRHCPYVR
jgi:hypothetical protein